MSQQIAIRIPEDQVEFIDRLISEGRATSRAHVISRALKREQRRLLALNDIAILTGNNHETDLDELAEYTSAMSLGDLD